VITGALCCSNASGAIDNIFGDFQYKFIPGDAVEISGYLGPGGEVVIPNSIAGKPATSIGLQRSKTIPPYPQ
jgi:hypothetical protein